ncbi:hypothetical protein J6590_006319 [Homalodisca vitripennis]|nr:hypothetical protein J6590_006319 [Homalodisca vitripennis]
MASRTVDRDQKSDTDNSEAEQLAAPNLPRTSRRKRRSVAQSHPKKVACAFNILDNTTTAFVLCVD